MRLITDYDIKITWFNGWPKKNWFSFDEPHVVQDRSRSEFPISAGIGLVSNSKCNLIFFKSSLVTRKWKNKSLIIKLVTRNWSYKSLAIGLVT